jgi:hypothetical protein
MKTKIYILALIMSVAAFACDKDIAYTRAYTPSVKAAPVKPLIDPCTLSDGSIVTITADSTSYGRYLFPPFYLTKISKDGTVTSTELKGLYDVSTLYYEELKLKVNDADEIFFENFWQFYEGDLLKFDKDLNLIYHINLSDKGYYPCTGITTKDGGYLMIATKSRGKTNENKVQLLQFDGNGVLQSDTEITLEWYEWYAHNLGFRHINAIGDDKMVLHTLEKPQTGEAFFTYRIYTTDGKLRKYGFLNDVNDTELLYKTQTFSRDGYLYVAKADSTFAHTQILKIDSNHDTIFSKEIGVSHIYSFEQSNGMITIVGPQGPCPPQKDASWFGYVAHIKPYLSDIKGKILTMNPDNGEIISTATISLDGGTVPYTAIESADGYDIFMSRVFDADINNNIEWLYNNKVYIYHVDNLQKLDLNY